MESADALLRNSRRVINDLVRLLETLALWVNAEQEEDVWECAALLHSMGSSLEISRGLMMIEAASAEQHVGSVLESCVLGRGLLYTSLALSIRAGLFDDEKELARYRELLELGDAGSVEVIVAYLDHLDVSDNMEKFGTIYPMIGRRFAGGLPSFPWRSYYWTASDTYLIFHVLGTRDLASEVSAFIADLIHVQDGQWTGGGGTSWMWQIGVTVAEAKVFGDIIIPSRRCALAAALMKAAKQRNRQGGLILIDPQVVKRAAARNLRQLLRKHDPKVLIDIGWKRVRTGMAYAVKREAIGK